MSWISGPANPEGPAGSKLTEALLDLAVAAFEHGRAVERRDEQAARRGHRASLAALQAVLNAVDDGPAAARDPGSP